MSLRGGTTKQSPSYTERTCMATRLPRYARNDMLFILVDV